ncbi:MAG: cell division protein ZapE [Rickettsiaceae bacterium]|nr:cell division protein ZapE [Rickettsiaceae bacterium]
MSLNVLGVDLDNKQQKLIKKLNAIASHLNSSSVKKAISRIINTLKAVQDLSGKRLRSSKSLSTHGPDNKFEDYISSIKYGIYIHGCVGCGKSTIAKAFFDHVVTAKKFLHYQAFIRNIHRSLKTTDVDNVIDNLAMEYDKIKLLCIDEFEIKDITDAMIVSRLLFKLKKRGVFILITTNTAPHMLYKGGIQRESFVPFIEMILRDFEIFHFSNNIDYRMKYIPSKKRVIYPLDEERKIAMEDAISHLISGYEPSITKLVVFGRELVFSRTYKSVLIADFNELCRSNLSYNDYIEICNHFSYIVMENVPIITAEDTDIAIRFIHFIDSVYFTKRLLLISLVAEPCEIYKNGKMLEEFKRTVSRLHEMGSDDYFIN